MKMIFKIIEMALSSNKIIFNTLRVWIIYLESSLKTLASQKTLIILEVNLYVRYQIILWMNKEKIKIIILIKQTKIKSLLREQKK